MDLSRKLKSCYKIVLLLLFMIVIFTSCISNNTQSLQDEKELLINNDKIKDEKSSLIFDTIIFGKYEQDNILDNGKEDIEWYVIDEDSDSMLLLSKYVIDILPYDATNLEKNTYENGEKCYWETSYIRKWLNNVFYEVAFDEDEKNEVINSNIKNGLTFGADNLQEPIDMGPDTYDNVFILSKDEMRKYLGYEKNNKNLNYIALYTSYAKENDEKIKNTDFDIDFAIWHKEREYGKEYINNAEYLLRSPMKITKVSDLEYTSLIVGKDGHISNRTFPYFVSNKNESVGQYYKRGVRPAMRIIKRNYINKKIKVDKSKATESIIIKDSIPNTYTIENVKNVKPISEYDLNDDIEIFDTVEFGRFEQDNNESNGKELIKWIVLEMDDDKALLLSKYILDIVEYSNIIDRRVLWKNSSLRAYANNEFYQDIFNEKEKAFILPKKMENYENPVFDSFVDSDTVDKISILSFDECIKYFDIDYMECIVDKNYSVNNVKSKKMKTYPTPYAKEKFLSGDRIAIDASESDFWLRNQGYSGEEETQKVNYQMSGFETVDFKGRVYDICDMNNEDSSKVNLKLGFRPLILVDINILE